MSMAQSEWEELASLPRVMKITGIAKSSIYNRMRAGTFPKPVKVGRRALWPVSRLHAWVDKVIAENDAADSSKDVGTE
ncbi:AlpA family phage regulatory protein [Xanthomonas sp. MUS 060]|uniref:helix-turn-helix transcriptional regulator n=1 Tax=Xanthomonas sp. MUS 060 TaxID=1588031 RepID=UPI0005F2DD93|nr:AlpA family phage regulatory protein [Xanthomonas sp. MUS 060]